MSSVSSCGELCRLVESGTDIVEMATPSGIPVLCENENFVVTLRPACIAIKGIDNVDTA